MSGKAVPEQPQENSLDLPARPAFDLDFAYVENFLEQAIGNQAIPGAVAVWGNLTEEPHLIAVGRQGISRNRRPVHPNLIYDLASVTKIISTTSLTMILAGRGQLDISEPLFDGPLAAVLPSSFDRRITPLHLLTHQSGLLAWHPFYSLAPAQNRRGRLEAICAVMPQCQTVAPGQETVYSDLNFILLGFLLEETTSQRQDELFRQEIAEKLGLTRTGYRPRLKDVAPTEDGFRQGGPVGHPQAAIKGPTPLGRPHDDNAAFLEGIAGHAGLFGTAEEIWLVVREWHHGLSGAGGLFNKATLEEFIRPRPTIKDEGRPLGFNSRRLVESMKGTHIPAEALGHLGYTGPSVWWDTQSGTAMVLLTNRVHPKVANPAWKAGYYQGLGLRPGPGS